MGEGVAPPAAPCSEAVAEGQGESLPGAEALVLRVALGDLEGAVALAVCAAALSVGGCEGVAPWQREGERVGGRVVVPVGEAVGVAEAPSGPRPEEAEGEPEALGEPLAGREREALRVPLAVALEELLKEALVEGEWDSREAEAELVAEGERESRALALGEREGVALRVELREVEPDAVESMVRVLSVTGLPLPEGEGLGEWVGDCEVDTEGEGLSEGVEEAEREAVGQGEEVTRVALAQGECCAEGELWAEGQG